MNSSMVRMEMADEAARTTFAKNIKTVLEKNKLEEGAEDYILKPFNPLELKIRIKKIID